MVHHIHPAVPLRSRGAVLLLFLLCCAEFSSSADSMPSFVKTPEDQTGISGGVASFVCQATGEPKPRITWMKKGKKVSSQRFEVIEFDDGSGSVLRIQPLRTHRDEAIYECTATNSAGEINTSAKLTVLEENQIPHGFPTIDMGPQLKVVERTRTATMLCAASGNPDPEISWYKDMLPVDINSSNGRIKQLRSGGTPIRGALQIENSEESDQGKYECVAMNSAGTRYSAPANLYVRVRRVPPRFSIPPTNQEVMPGGSVNLTCVAVGSPMPYVKWTKGGEDLTKEEEMPMGRNVHEVTNIRESANYTCVAMSSLGIIEATAQVTVKALPKPPTSLIVTETTATSVTLTWDSGNPEPVAYYMIQYRPKVSDNGFQEVEGVATTRYSIGGLSPFSEYEFRVMAVNNIGRGPPSDPVETRTGEQAPSSPPLQVQARMLSATTMLVQWAQPEEPNGQIRGYRVYYSSDLTAPLSAWQKHNTDDSHLTTISGLTPDITYSLRVLGFTSVGDGPPSDILQVKTQQGVPAQPSSFEAEAELDTCIRLTWLWPVQDPITKYELQYWEAGSDHKEHVTFDPVGTYAVERLKPDTLYRFSLAARSEMGLGVYTQPIEARTAQSTPSAPPQDVQLLSLSSTRLMVSWVAPPAASRHGAIVRYTVSYQALAGEDTQRHEVSGIGADATSYVLDDLEKWTEYQVWVRAHTDVGPGPESPPVRMRTKEDVPGAPPRKLEVEALNSTAIRVSWKPPLQLKQHGQIRGYQVIFSRLENGEPRGQPNIMDVALPEAQWNIDESTEHEAVIAGLQSETTYSVTVAAYTTKGDGARSKAKVITTTGAVPGKPSMIISTTTENTALVQWQPPKEMVGELMGYQLQYKRTDDDSYVSRELRKVDEHFTVTGLHKGATYVFRLSARNRAGIGEAYVKEITTAEDVPTGYPLNLQVTGLTQSSTQLTWEPPLLAERNGKILHYVVVYRDINSQRNSTNRTAHTNITIHGLNPDTTYDIRVQAFTSKGGGPLSPSIQSRTMSNDFPTLNFGVKAVMKTSVLLTWDLPPNYKAQTPFKILYNQQSVEVHGDRKRKLISQLEPDTDYSFVLISRGNMAGGLQQQVSVRTAPDLIKTKPMYSTHQAHGGKMTIKLPKVQTTTSVRWYYVVVVPVSQARQWTNPDEMDLDELLKSSEGPALRRRRRHLDSSKPFIAAKLTSLPTNFTLGDEKMYNGFFNKPLTSQQMYLCFVLAVLRNKGADNSANYMTFSASPYSDLIQVTTVEQPEMLWVMGPVLAVILIIISVIAILLLKNKPERKRASPVPKDDHSGGVKEHLLQNSNDPVEMRRLNYQTPGPSTHRCPNTPRMREHPPITVADLADHIERLKANDSLRFSQEYESIDPGQQFTWENSNMEVNKPKNRYANVIAYDHSRVVLTPVDAVPGSDYINANYIDGYRKQNAYIATQGPLPETLSDFWRMVWEQRSNTIVMMTRLEEKSRVKCDQYWPIRGTETYGMIQVTMLDTVDLATYSVRTFALYKNGSSEKREVRQFQFMAWPDHGVPEYPTPILAFLRRVKACNPPDAGPMVVHCSAGVGRTGCFIVIDAMLERMKHEKSVDIYGHVTCMRAQRNYMVQTEDQYIFIHEALLEAATCGNTEVPARNLYAHIQKLTQPPAGETVTAMELEFKRLANSKAHTSRFISANLPCNKFKNRLVNIMPFESTRVCLQPIRGVEGSDYINASCIDGYRQQKAYLATQGPLAETTEDFWRMLWEHNSTIVVMLTKLREMGREKCHQYWPAERSARYQYFVVDPMAEYNMPQYILREFKVTDARDGQSRTIRQFQFTDWPEQGVPKTGEGFIDFIGQVHKTKEQFGQDGPITVHCSAGVGRTGVFITLSIVLERMRYEGVVDLFQTVKTLRTQRPAMVQTEDQYQLCYRAALEYLGSFDHYAT
ncbi:receptor-type tyrosine-protein phosphatase F isoform X1 [Synchiropus splendidus]|uniref:receptor-type tyrosine-protein phosphatase F isoform X1 n=1 Tax=Synchiropus splendidus TaxID=270530 RepID=UPI00237EDA18|nr:receptor-type tyrosine-protein phosphatase F isoform X1 [Synchiropus splendidus]XP_053738719.1 receptor-type tyrosine-protein phosphatase F isoform X1 [Synchiropus splendidus]XP_053738720.1 receptor-type tyrosine-protein phosphatase F isoform X1 [Synchiropus splendidus]XP_053738721.1 receptor-type tyrosine-protein phosphatase F isoform X1 [Synchiropus splendidus]